MARNWSQLSTGYRERLERGGITRQAYESGASLSAARGHGATPEKPLTSLENVPARFASYAELRREIIQTKEAQAIEAGTRLTEAWYTRQLKALTGYSRAKLEKMATALDMHFTQNMSWDELRDMFPEFDDHDWEVLEHYH